METQHHFVEWINIAKAENICRARGGVPDTGVWDYVEMEEATERREFKALDEAKRWAECHTHFDAYEAPRIETQSWPEGQKYMAKIDCYLEWQDGEWSDVGGAS